MNNIFEIPKNLNSKLAEYDIYLDDIVLYINSKCNLRCKHCYVGNDLLNKNNKYEYNSIIKFLSDFQYLSRLTILGGEPLLYKEITPLLNFVQDKDFKEIRITTNLTDLSLLNINKIYSNRIRFCVSLDGHNKEEHEYVRGKNTFHKTISHLERLIQNEIDVEITHTINSRNINYFEDFIKLCIKIGVKNINLHRVSLQGNALLNRKLKVTPTEWVDFRNYINTISYKEVENECISIRYPILFVTEKEFQKINKKNLYHDHYKGSFYGNKNRLVIYSDGNLFISSEAFGTESYIGSIQDGEFIFNDSALNEIKIMESGGDISKINQWQSGDENYPIVLSVSYKETKFIPIKKNT